MDSEDKKQRDRVIARIAEYAFGKSPDDLTVEELDWILERLRESEKQMARRAAGESVPCL